MTDPTSLVTAGDPAGQTPAAGAPAANQTAGDPAANPAPGGAAQDATANPPADGKTDDGKPSGAPEKYEDFKLPEGFEADTETLAEAQSLFKEMNLSQDAAQKLVDMWTGKQRTAQEANTKAWTDLRTAWVNEAKADKEFGGQNFNASLGLAKNALKAFGTPKLNEALEFSGMGDHPELIRFLTKVGKAIGEDSLKFGHAGQSQPKKDASDVLYPNEKS